MLKAHEPADSFLERGPTVLDATDNLDPIAEPLGTVIGPYKLIEPIGEGGMGSVWMAQQTEPIKRLVAVKLIRAGMDSRQVIARFEAERQALALMDHPNIARVLDAGTTSAGRPYFVMDLVKGVPITRYCDEHHLTPRQRLELFIPVCQAVQHAHQKGIIHRDLKPSNVLVAQYDGKPVPKIIDFGVAKAAGQQLTEKTLVTGFGAIVGTLEYMSPEQAELNQLDIDTRSDIYSLGVLLYELLTGSPPFSRKELTQAGMLEMLRVIREQEPSKPSTKLSTAEGLPTLAANRGTEPAKLTKLVRGELDWIVMKALEKDRNRRYETANGFAIDVQRFLSGEPVLAVPATTLYRLRKFVKRHRGPVAAVGLVLLTLVGGIAGTTSGLLRAAAKNREAVAQRDAKDRALISEQQARADETKARQQAFAALRSMTTDVVERKFAQGTALTADDRAFLRGVIAQFDAFAAIKGNDAGSRFVRADGRSRVGNIRRRLGELKEAEQDLGQAMSMYKELAADFPGRPDFRKELAATHRLRGLLLVQLGRLREAEPDINQAVTLNEQLAADFASQADDSQELARSFNNRGLLRQETGRPKEAEQDFEQVLRIYTQLGADFLGRPDFRKDLARGQHNLAFLLSITGRLPEALTAFDQALGVQKQLAAEFPSQPEFRNEAAVTHIDRGTLLVNMGRPKEAEEDCDQAVRIYTQLAADFPSAPEFRTRLATGHHNRGNVRLATGRLPLAEKDFDQALSINKQLAADFPSQTAFRHDLASSRSARGSLLLEMGRLKEAEQEYDQTLSVRKQLVAESPSQPDLRKELGGTFDNLALVYLRQGYFAAAKPLLLEGLPHHLAALKVNPRHPQYRLTYRKHLSLLPEVHAELLEQEDAVHAALAVGDLGYDPPADAYDAACLLSRCVRRVSKHDKLDDKERQQAAQFYGDEAMKLLRAAVSKGFKNVAHMKKDTDLDPLRKRDDFQKLVAELEAAAVPEKDKSIEE